MTFESKHADVNIFEPDIRMLLVDACPANLLSFGHTCPSPTQSIKRYLSNNMMTHLLVPQKLLIKVDIAKAKYTKKKCDSLKASLQSTAINRSSKREFSLSHLNLNKGNISSTRSAGVISDLLSCRGAEVFSVENVNSELHPQVKKRSKRNKMTNKRKPDTK